MSPSRMFFSEGRNGTGCRVCRTLAEKPSVKDSLPASPCRVYCGPPMTKGLPRLSHTAVIVVVHVQPVDGGRSRGAMINAVPSAQREACPNQLSSFKEVGWHGLPRHDV